MVTNKYAVVCVNEELYVVSVNIHDTLDEAYDEMQAEVERELDSCEDGGFDAKCDIGPRQAYVDYGDSRYNWTIKDVMV